MDKKALTLRIPAQLAENLEAIAKVNGTSVNETARQALAEHVERRRKDPEFQAALYTAIEQNKAVLERLAAS